MILALDTTGAHGSIALLRRGKTVNELTVDELAMHEPDGYSHVLFGHVEEILRRNGAILADVECFAAACGPGSFTGVRVGLACIKGFAEALGKPAIGVSNLQAIATFGAGPLRAAVMDARRGDVYAAVYDALGNLVQRETVAKLSEWLKTLPFDDLEILSPDVDSTDAVVKKIPRAIAGAVARLAMVRMARGEAADAAALDANYVRRSDAELAWKDVV